MPPAPTPPSGLDNPAHATHAWRRFRLIMAWMTAAAGAAAVAAILIMQWLQGPLPFITKLATLGGVGGTVMLTGALMGLVFLSSGTGHDEDVERFRPGD